MAKLQPLTRGRVCGNDRNFVSPMVSPYARQLGNVMRKGKMDS